MKIIREQEVHGDHIEAPNKRVIKHLSAPWTLGSRNLWVGTSTVEPGNETNAHAHKDNEEVFYCVSGSGVMIVDGEREDYRPGTVVYCPPGSMHQVVNTGSVPLKSVCSVSPPFEMTKFRDDHDMGE